MERWKGSDVVLQALAKLRDVPGWIFWLAGGPQRTIEQPYFQLLQEMASKLGIAERVRFLGQRSDVVQLMKAADIYTQGNRGPEGFSVSFIEACSAGMPILTTKLGGAIEIVDAATGLLVEPENTADFAEALSTLLQNAAMRRDMGEAARRKIVAMCEPEQQLHRLRSLIESLNTSNTDSSRDEAAS
jgi:glycosyltransferase involved in cell wall biosynthesis